MNLSTFAPAIVTLPWRAYLHLCKPRVVALVVFTAMIAMLLAAPSGQVPWSLLLTATLGITLAGASAAAFNQVVDRDIDAQMCRTRGRPLPSGSLTVDAASRFAALLGTLALVLLWWAVNPLTAVLTLFTLIGYAVIYTRYLKWIGPQNIVLGGVAGAAPVLLGWCAVSGHVDWQAVSLFLIILVWTPPHFWALAIARRNEYAEAGVPMLPVTHGVAYTRRAILAYTLALLPVTLLPGVAGLSGPLYLGGAAALGSLFVLRAFLLLYTDGDRAALRLFRFSITYLVLLFALLLADHFFANL